MIKNLNNKCCILWGDAPEIGDCTFEKQLSGVWWRASSLSMEGELIAYRLTYNTVRRLIPRSNEWKGVSRGSEQWEGEFERKLLFNNFDLIREEDKILEYR